VRELSNEIHRVVLQAKNGEAVGVEKLSPAVRSPTRKATAHKSLSAAEKIVIDAALPYHQAKDELQRALILRKLQQHGGNLSRAAAELQMDRKGLQKAMVRLGIKSE
jgi:transcriptional regulator with GAF, ATPase, and Fis domain